MDRKKLLTASLLAVTFLIVALAGSALAGPPTYKPHLEILGFDTLGAPSNGLNTEIVFDSRGFVYVGSLSFDPAEEDVAVKAVDVSDPANPIMTAAVDPLGGLFGTFDVKIAGRVLAASTQGPPESDPGVTLMDITDPANPQPKSHLDDEDLKSPDGSHNSFLWQDPLTGKVWLFATGLDDTSLMLFDVTDPSTPVFTAEYNNENPGGPFIHDNFVQEVSGRVFEYMAGNIGVEILDVTRIVRGGNSGPLTSDDVVALNHYTSNPDHAQNVTRPLFAHYVEPTASGNVAWVGDETECGENSIIHAFDASSLPLPGNPAKLLPEIGTIITPPDTDLCPAILHANNPNGQFNSQSQAYRWTGHNFDVIGDELLIRGDYGRGVGVYDISNPGNASLVAKSRGMNLGVGDENNADPGRDTFLENYPWVWQAVYDGDLIYASDIMQGLYVLDLVGD